MLIKKGVLGNWELSGYYKKKISCFQPEIEINLNLWLFKMKIGLKWKSGWWRVLQNRQSSTKKLFPSPSTTYVKGTGKEIWTFAMFIGIGYVSFCENLTLISDLVLPISSQCCFAMQIKGLVSIWNTTPGWNGLILW